MMNLNPIVATACHAQVAVAQQRFATLCLPSADVWSGFSAAPEMAVDPATGSGKTEPATRFRTADSRRCLLFNEGSLAHHACANLLMSITPTRLEVAASRTISRITPDDRGSTRIKGISTTTTDPRFSGAFPPGQAVCPEVPRAPFLGIHHHTVSLKASYYHQAVANLDDAVRHVVVDGQRELVIEAKEA